MRWDGGGAARPSAQAAVCPSHEEWMELQMPCLVPGGKVVCQELRRFSLSFFSG